MMDMENTGELSMTIMNSNRFLSATGGSADYAGNRLGAVNQTVIGR